MARRLILLALVFTTTSAWSIVDMRNSNLSETYEDLSLPGAGYDLQIQRTYNSRAVYSGLFGFGWCSDLETKLEISPENSIIVTECGAGQRIPFFPKGMKGDGVDKTVKKILAGAKKKNPKLTKKDLAKLKKQLKIDYYLRDEFSRRLGLKGKIKKGQSYFAEGRQNESIVKISSGYKRRLADGSFQKFNSEGRLTHLYDRNRNYIKIDYKNDRISTVIDNKGRKLSFSYKDKSKRVSKIKGPKDIKLLYKYDGEDLRYSKNMWGNEYIYSYDDLHNLTKVTFPDKTTREIKYNKDRDWVISFKDRRDCVETYDYGEDKKDPLNHYWSKVEKKCGKKVTNRSRYEFWHKVTGDGSRYLHRSLTNNNGDRVDTIYHPVFGKPISVVRNGIKVRYKYSDRGLLRVKEEPKRTYSYYYKNKCQKVSDVITKFYQIKREVATTKDGKKKERSKKQLVKKVKTDFFYDKNKCNLRKAKNTDGQIVLLNYDSQGRIKEITDQARKKVKLNYDEASGKPSIVTRPGLGTIRVTYDDDGAIEDVKSKEGPVVAVQVASIFNNMLEIISPATEELSL